MYCHGVGRLLAISKGIDALNRRIGRAVAWLTAAMVAIGAFNAVARYLERDLDLRLSSNSLLELQWYLFAVVFLLGAPYALRRDAHVRVDVIYSGHGRRARAWIDLVGALVFLVPFCAFAVYVSWGFVADSWIEREMSPDPGGLPRWILKPAVPIAFALLALQGFSEIIKRAAILRGRSPEAVGLEEALE
jgi:TRAP-type mannitol/chloroaromatic compound transport system permease small subunit